MSATQSSGRKTRDEEIDESTPLLIEERGLITLDPDDDIEDSQIIDFEDGDAEHPYNWPRWQTLSNCLLISGMTFLTALASCEFIGKSIHSINYTLVADVFKP